MKPQTPTPHELGLFKAIEIQRLHDPKAWRARVDEIESAEERAAAEEYLRGILTRMKAQRAAALHNRGR